MTLRLGPAFVSGAAIASGMFGIVGAAILAVWGATRLAGGDSAPQLGTIADLLLVAEYLALMPVAALVPRLASRTRQLWWFVAVIGLLALTTFTVVQLLHIGAVIRLGEEAPLAIAALGLAGVWVMGTSWLGRSASILLARVAWVGWIAGACALLLVGSYFVLGDQVAIQSFHYLRTRPLLLAGLSVGLFGWGIGLPL
jgi:hypothetical protein